METDDIAIFERHTICMDKRAKIHVARYFPSPSTEVISTTVNSTTFVHTGNLVASMLFLSLCLIFLRDGLAAVVNYPYSDSEDAVSCAKHGLSNES